MGMTNEEREIALYCLKASSDYHSEVCEECVKYPNCDHMIQDDVTETIIKALEQQPCEDCISRKDVIILIDEATELHPYKVIGDSETYSNYNQGWEDACNWLYANIESDNLKSVTPQNKSTGSWVEKQVVDNEEVEIEQWQSARCSKCDKYHTTPYSYYFDDYNYCPNCGAKMESEDEE